MNFLLTGANRGIGLEISKQLLGAGHKLWACCRTTDSESLKQLKEKYGSSITVVKMDVSDENSVKTAYETIKSQTPDLKFDVVYNNAGVLESGEDNMQKWNYDNFARSIQINTMGPVYVARNFLPMIKTPGGQLIAMSTRVSSIEDNGSGRLYSYRSSKAALNMAWKNVSLELKDKGLKVYLTHPGNVASDMNPNGNKSAQESAQQLLDIVYNPKDEYYGKLVSWDKSIIPW